MSLLLYFIFDTTKYIAKSICAGIHRVAKSDIIYKIIPCIYQNDFLVYFGFGGDNFNGE
jgi:hypothetical protein